jgi:indolepyruvate ferredoxin oxidoreductase
MAFLTDYQNAAYAQRYKNTLERFAARSGAGSEALLMAAARSLFKLMAYKDEYEVARLHSRTGFDARIADMFEPGYRVNYHLAPPIWPTGRDTRGRPFKRAFGPWMGRAFGVLARMKGLRGTWADVFAYGADRRLEVALIGWFEEVMQAVAAGGLTEEQARTVLAAPMEIRGYGPVKEKAAEKVQAEVAAVLRGNG